MRKGREEKKGMGEKKEGKEEERNARERKKLKAIFQNYFSVNYLHNRDLEKYSRVMNCMLGGILSF